jgi:hypothetical protein
MASAQAFVREKRSPRSLLEAVAGVGQKRITHPLKIVTANGEAIPAQPGDYKRVLQNVGLNTVYVCVGIRLTTLETTPGPVPVYHYALAPGVAVDDGYGAGFDFSGTAEAIYVYSVTGAHKVAVLRMSDPEAGL